MRSGTLATMVQERIVVIGGGTMGAGIAHRCVANGYLVEVVDLDLGAAEAAVGRIAASLHGAAERGKLDDAPSAIERLTPMAAIGDVDPEATAIIEAVNEDVGLKHRLLATAEQRSPRVLASNTSSISIDELASVLDRPECFVGMHFFNPVWAMDLVEVVRGARTDSATIAVVSQIVDRLGMERALINDAPGFATSRLGVLVGLEAIRMVEQGVASPVDIDRAMRLGYRHPMGPLMLGDLVGLDVRLGIARHLASVYGARFEPPALLVAMVERGDLGKKSGRGFYDWSSGSAEVIEER
ncbi:MAG: 3-hydroxyacyl-CoA dehydrogenase family protein [Acidimicrobiia bacterium]|nr:3-hydroxyacyl-CoA dehydrogenase family protein [Acidimicrobiia bacterium]